MKKLTTEEQVFALCALIFSRRTGFCLVFNRLRAAGLIDEKMHDQCMERLTRSTPPSLRRAYWWLVIPAEEDETRRGKAEQLRDRAKRRKA